MRDELLHVYERELSYLRRVGVEFARRYPQAAGRLLLEPNRCDDPHVERLLEGFAFLAARVHLKLDDDFSEFSEALLGLLFPHYTRPLPAMSLVELRLDPDQGKLTTGFPVPRGSLLYYARGEGAPPCKFQTCYDTTVWPLRVAAARWMAPYELRPSLGAGTAPSAATAVAALSVRLECLPDVEFSQLELDSLRLHLSAELGLAANLYELLLNGCREVVVRPVAAEGAAAPATAPLVLDAASVLHPGGFGPDETMLPPVRRAFHGHQLLLDYFALPEKYLFLELQGLAAAREHGFGRAVELVFLVQPFERADRHQALQAGVTADTIRLGCTPIVNLFPHTSEPVSVTPKKHEHLVVADARRRETTEIFSVDEVVAASASLRFEPLYSSRHGTDGARRTVFWHASRRPTAWRLEEGTDVHLSFVDSDARPLHPDVGAVTAHLLCHNGTLPSRLPFRDPAGDFQLQSGGPVRVHTLANPTPVVQPPLGRPQLWRLISQLSLNYVSLVDGGPEALQELLRLHNRSQSAAGERQIAGIVGLRGEPAYARVRSPHGFAFARGQRVSIELDEDHFPGGGAFLLSSVLERVLGLYVSMNSFSMLSASTRQRKGLMREWSPRAGGRTVL